MPRIRPYEGRFSGGVGPVGQRTAQASQVGNALSGLGNTVTNVSNEYEEMVKKKQAFEASQKIIEFKRESLDTLDQLKKNQKPGAEGYTENFKKFYQERRDKILEESDSDFQRDRLELSLDEMGLSLEESASRYETQQASNFSKQQFSENLDGIRKSVIANPEFVDSSWKTVEQTINTNPYFNETEKAMLSARAKSEVYDDALGGELINIEKNPSIKSGQIDSFIGELKKDGNRYKSSSSPVAYKNALARLENFRDIKKKSEVTMDLYDFDQEMRYTESTGNDRNLYTPEKIKSWGLNARMTENLLRKLDTAKEVATVFQEVKDRPFPELMTEVSEQTIMETLKNDPDNYDKNLKKLSIKQKLVQAQLQKFQSDPAQYTIEASPSIRNLYDAMNENPEDTDLVNEYARVAIEKQNQLMPGMEPSLLPRQEIGAAKQILSSVARDPKGAEKAATFLSGLTEKWGQYYPTIVKDLKKNKAMTPGQYHAAAMLDNPELRPVAEKMLYADSFSNAELNKSSILSEGKARAEIEDLMTDFRDSFKNSTEQSKTENYSDLLSSMTKMYRHALYNGENISASDIYEGVIDSRYQFYDGNRIPKKIKRYSPEQGRFVYDDIELYRMDQGMSEGRRAIKKAEIAPPMPGMTPADLQAYRESVIQNGRWVNNGDKGLRYVTDKGHSVFLKFGEGDKFAKYERTFEELHDQMFILDSAEQKRQEQELPRFRNMMGDM